MKKIFYYLLPLLLLNQSGTAQQDSLTLRITDEKGQIIIGAVVLQYPESYRTNWYFMGGDNMWNSQDSRYLGPIPEEFIIGKATLILTAKDPETKAYRWRRFFTRIRKEVKNR